MIPDYQSSVISLRREIENETNPTMREMLYQQVQEEQWALVENVQNYTHSEADKKVVTTGEYHNAIAHEEAQTVKTADKQAQTAQESVATAETAAVDKTSAEEINGAEKAYNQSAIKNSYINPVITENFNDTDASSTRILKRIDYSNNINYNAQAAKTIENEFKASTDNDVVSFYERVKSGQKTKPYQYVSDVNRQQAKDMAELTGINISNSGNGLDRVGVEHIDNRHGTKGKADQSISDSDDVGRIDYVLNNYDIIELLDERSHRFSDKNNNMAPLVRISKRVNGTIYIVEAVADSQRNKVWIESIYKKEAPNRSFDSNNTNQATVEPSPKNSASYNNSIFTQSENVNNSNTSQTTEDTQKTNADETPAEDINGAENPFYRTEKKPEVTFDEWLNQRDDINKSRLATEYDMVEGLAGITSAATVREKGKAKSSLRRVEYTNTLRYEYNEAVKNGDIKQIEQHVPLDLTNENDRAYVRMQIKRAERKGQTEKTQVWQNYYDGKNTVEADNADNAIERDVNGVEKQTQQNDSKLLTEIIAENANKLSGKQSVKDLKGNEFTNDGTSLFSRVMTYFKSLGNKVYTEAYGDVYLTKKSFKNDMAHGWTNEKITAFAAIKEVLTNGQEIAYRDYGDYERIVVAAPITIGGKPYNMGVMIHKTNDVQRMNIHNVVLIEGSTPFNQDMDITDHAQLNENETLFSNILPSPAENVNNSNNSQTNYDTQKADADDELDRQITGSLNAKASPTQSTRMAATSVEAPIEDIAKASGNRKPDTYPISGGCLFFSAETRGFHSLLILSSARAYFVRNTLPYIAEVYHVI